MVDQAGFLSFLYLKFKTCIAIYCLDSHLPNSICSAGTGGLAPTLAFTHSMLILDFLTLKTLFSSTQDSAHELKEICQSKNYKFNYFSKLPPIKELDKNDKKTTHKIIIFEDQSYLLAAENTSFIMDLCTFLLGSRHGNISLISILHQLSFPQKSSFDRIFLANCTNYVIFIPKTSKHETVKFLKNVLYKDAVKYIDDIFQFAATESDYAYIFIDVNKSLGDKSGLSHIRTDLFGKNYIFYKDT